MKITETETETAVTTGYRRKVTVNAVHHGTYLRIDDTLEGGVVSARLEPDEARTIAHALLGIDDHHGLDGYAARVFAKHRRDCHDGNIDDDCAACLIAVGAASAFPLSHLADLRARWANENQTYDEGGLLTGPRYVEQFAPRDEAAELDDLRAALNDALARATRAEDRLARIRNAYSDLVVDARQTVDTVYAVTEEQIDAVWVTVHTTATARDLIREYRTDRRTVLPGETPERLREAIESHLQSIADLEAIARAMEE